LQLSVGNFQFLPLPPTFFYARRRWQAEVAADLWQLQRWSGGLSSVAGFVVVIIVEPDSSAGCGDSEDVDAVSCGE